MIATTTLLVPHYLHHLGYWRNRTKIWFTGLVCVGSHATCRIVRFALEINLVTTFLWQSVVLQCQEWRRGRTRSRRNPIKDRSVNVYCTSSIVSFLSTNARQLQIPIMDCIHLTICSSIWISTQCSSVVLMGLVAPTKTVRTCFKPRKDRSVEVICYGNIPSNLQACTDTDPFLALSSVMQASEVHSTHPHFSRTSISQYILCCSSSCVVPIHV